MKTLFFKISSRLYDRFNVSHNLISNKAFKKQAALLRKCDVTTIFDVGARYGGISKKYLKYFPKSEVYAFEPFPKSFEKLKKNAAKHSNIIPIQLAVTDVDNKEKLFVNKYDFTNSLLPSVKTGTVVDEVTAKKDEIEVETITIDSFCKQQEIEKIDVLKMDIQGGELKALNGAKTMLSQNKVKLIYTEVLFMNIYEGQPHFEDIAAYLNDIGYRLHGLFNEWHINKQKAWADAIFLSSELTDGK
ncbi:MAG: hypothetical protein COA57_04180 [Flavobacteriales bacterium]|nr:MAG: hypothetical protein COA57_04180 [Flavobacteriales bacterium]